MVGSTSSTQAHRGVPGPCPFQPRDTTRVGPEPPPDDQVGAASVIQMNLVMIPVKAPNRQPWWGGQPGSLQLSCGRGVEPSSPPANKALPVPLNAPAAPLAPPPSSPVYQEPSGSHKGFHLHLLLILAPSRRRLKKRR